MFKRVLAFLCLFTVSLFISTNASLAATFKDVPEKHFAKEAIQWASDTRFVEGVGNGLFKPNDPISFEQFAKLTASYFELEQSTYELTPMGGSAWIISNRRYASWSKSYYDQLAAYQVPYLYYFDDESLRKRLINRGLLAQVFGYLLNGDAELQNSILYLQDKGITKMKYPNYKSAELQFDIKGTLTRAEAVTFFYRLHEKGFKQLNVAVKENFKQSSMSATEFREGVNSAEQIVDAQVTAYINGTLPKFYSAEVRALENDMFKKELSDYNLVLNIDSSFGEFSLSAAEKMLKKLTKPIITEMTKQDYEMVSAIYYKNKELNIELSTVRFKHPKYGPISLAEEDGVLTLRLGNPYMKVSDEQLKFFAKIISAVTNTTISGSQILALEKEYQTKYSPSNPMFYFDKKKTISFAPDNSEKYEVAIRVK